MYGTAQTPSYKGRDATLRDFEKFTLEHGGYQVSAEMKTNVVLGLSTHKSFSSDWELDKVKIP